jgi:hypothetical protein
MGATLEATANGVVLFFRVANGSRIFRCGRTPHEKPGGRCLLPHRHEFFDKPKITASRFTALSHGMVVADWKKHASSLSAA